MTLRAVVKGVGHYLPARVVPNSELEALVETTDEWIRSRSGIERRHFAAEGETTSDLGAAATPEAFGTCSAVTGIATACTGASQAGNAPA